jgi:hypothetical protein
MWESFTNNSKHRGFRSDGIDENHPRFQDMCRWMYNHNPMEYDGHMNRYDPYRYEKYPQAQEFIRQRAQYRGLGVQPGYSDYNRGGEDFYQQVQQISQYYNGGHRQEEPPNVTVTQRVSKLNKLLKKLKL